MSERSVAERQQGRNGRPVLEILQEMAGHLGEIVRSEILLLTLNFRKSVAARKRAALTIVLGNVLILYGGAFLLLGLVYALSMIWPSWLAAIGVGILTAVAGGVLLTLGVKGIKNPKST
jgi:hypothetical protein